jgi:hypothetical protein
MSESKEFLMSGQTVRGFNVLRFQDRYGVECSIQQSSLATEDAIWFGVNDADPRIMASNAVRMGIDTGGQTTGWVPCEFPDEVSMTTRMHLTREQVAVLLPVLQRFVETGEVEVDP